jgi:hypothetical protein
MASKPSIHTCFRPLFFPASVRPPLLLLGMWERHHLPGRPPGCSSTGGEAGEEPQAAWLLRCFPQGCLPFETREGGAWVPRNLERSTARQKTRAVWLASRSCSAAGGPTPPPEEATQETQSTAPGHEDPGCLAFACCGETLGKETVNVTAVYRQSATPEGAPGRGPRSGTWWCEEPSLGEGPISGRGSQ